LNPEEVASDSVGSVGSDIVDSDAVKSYIYMLVQMLFDQM